MKPCTLRKLALLIWLSALACIAVPSTSGAKVFGEVEWGYSRYTSEGYASSASESLYQRYMLGYRGAGRLARGKLGEYKYTLGYEWADLNRHSAESERKGHLLYSFELSGRVPGFPISYNAFSRDMSRMMTYNYGNLERTEGGAPTIVNEDLISLTGGTHIISGASLDIGVRKNENYRAAPYFRELPRLVLRLNDDYTSDLNSSAPTHNRTSSYMGALGKGNLWVRYGVTTYTNYLVPEENSELQQLNVGTVDHRLVRTWVDVTNWIRLSADGQLSKLTSKGTSSGFNSISGVSTGDQYDLNIFAVATRERWNARTFNSFSRTVDRVSGAVGHQIDTPIYLDGDLGADSTWQARFVSRDSRDNLDTTVSRTLLSSFKLDTFKRSPFKLTPSISLERTATGGTTVVNAEGRVETASTRRFSDRAGIFASYGVKYTAKEEGAAAKETAYLQNLNGKIVYAVTDRLKADYSQSFSWNKGTAESAVSESGLNGLNQQTTLVRLNTTNNDYLQSVSTLGAAWQPTARLRVASQGSADIKKNISEPVDAIMSLSSSIDYVMPEYKFNTRAQYANRSYGSVNTSDWNVSASALYTPNKNLESSLRVLYTARTDADQESSSVAEIQQRLSYTINKPGYGARKLLQFVEESSFQSGDNSNSNPSVYKTRRNVTLTASYYPYQRLFVGATARYSLLDPGSVNEYFYNATVGLQYTKLQATIDYAYGHRNGNDKRIESRFSANLKKQF